jgi:hypothetical protein
MSTTQAEVSRRVSCEAATHSVLDAQPLVAPSTRAPWINSLRHPDPLPESEGGDAEFPHRLMTKPQAASSTTFAPASAVNSRS